jgi:segregation and condensation protein B
LSQASDASETATAASPSEELASAEPVPTPESVADVAAPDEAEAGVTEAVARAAESAAAAVDVDDDAAQGATPSEGLSQAGDASETATAASPSEELASAEPIPGPDPIPDDGTALAAGAPAVLGTDGEAAPAPAPGGDGTGADDTPEADPEEPSLDAEAVRGVLEALIFASHEPITPRQIGQVLSIVPKAQWQAQLEELQADYARAGRGLQLIEVAGGWQITTRPECNDWVRELLDPKTPTRLSIQALETLAVIAYKQPVTLPEVIALRGVKSGGVIRTLLEKRLIRIVGRKEVVGRPMLYGTTKDFLLHFGLKDVGELPKIEEFAEVLGEEVDVAGLKKAIEAPAPVEVPLGEAEPAAAAEAPTEAPSAAADAPDEAAEDA